MTNEHDSISAIGGTTPPIAEVTGVTKRFGPTLALGNVNLAVTAGEVHALVGRNGAGKSTLVSILTGLQHPDEGTVRFDGKPAPALGDRSAWRQSVACVYQKLTIIPDLTVVENLFLNQQTTHGPLIGWRTLQRRAAELLDEWDLNIDPRSQARDLNVEQQQMLEIARALSFGARFIILDEPTARLDAAGIARLFERVRALQKQGVTFLYISHHLQEIFDLCQAVTVFRDARHIVSDRIDAISQTALVEAMTGEAAVELVDPRPPLPASVSPLLSVVDLAVADRYRNVSFDVLPGEIVGLAGAASSGKFDVAGAIAGFASPDSGTISIARTPLKTGSVPQALKAGVGAVPRDRHGAGFVGSLSIGENVTMTVPHRLGRGGFISPRRQREVAEVSIDVLDIVPRNPSQLVDDLSGGNQQKVVMARALADDPRVLVLMAPTLGVDVKSRSSLMDSAVDAAKGGAAVVVASDDLDDLRYCHRVIVMFRGDVVAEYREQWDNDRLVANMEGIELADG